MAQFDVYPNPHEASAGLYPYLLNIQSDFLDSLPSAMIIPLADPGLIEYTPILQLNPYFNIEGQRLVAMSQEMAAVPRRLLKHPVTNLSPEREAILAALDLLFTGL